MGALSYSTVYDPFAYCFSLAVQRLAPLLDEQCFEDIWKRPSQASVGAIACSAAPSAPIEFVRVLPIGLFALLVWLLASIQVPLIGPLAAARHRFIAFSRSMTGGSWRGLSRDYSMNGPIRSAETLGDFPNAQ